MMHESLRGYVLTRDERDSPDGLEFELWASTDDRPARILLRGQEAVFFVERDSPAPPETRRAPLELQTFHHAPVDGLYFRSRNDFRRAREWLADRRVTPYESDVKPLDRFLMERFIFGSISIEGEAVRRENYREFINPHIGPTEFQPELSVLSIDIETGGFHAPLYSIAAAGMGREQVFMVGRGQDDHAVSYHADERGVLEAFFSWLRDVDPDVLIGWNVIGFDVAFLERKCAALGIPLRLGRAAKTARTYVLSDQRKTRRAHVPGRIVLDGIDMLHAAAWRFEDYSLDAVANELLGRGKLIESKDQRLETIQRMFRDDKTSLAAYNLEDCRLVLDIFDAADLLAFAVARSNLTGLPLDKLGGSIAAFDRLYLPRLHRKGFVAADVGGAVESGASPGGYVMDSKPGLYENVLVLDFKSLYPSIMRTFHIDPLAMICAAENAIPGFKGASFSREEFILPDLIAHLSEEREKAKRAGNKPLSQAIKIMMNSFYGVLATPACRFYQPRLASSITMRGHEIIRSSREVIESHGYDVLYGDTDSLFVLVGPDHSGESCREIGRKLVSDLNAWWSEHLRGAFDVESHLEIQFETHYLRFFMPTVRGSEEGSKKRYAGYVLGANDEPEFIFKGLESARTDWTPLARRFQRELYRRVFLDEPYEEYVRRINEELFAGNADGELYYRKRIRRPLHEYRKNVPPHVQAARKLESAGSWITYAITVNGPEPKERHTSPFDYHHYRDRQLAPVADSILQFHGTSFRRLTEAQLEMF